MGIQQGFMTTILTKGNEKVFKYVPPTYGGFIVLIYRYHMYVYQCLYQAALP